MQPKRSAHGILHLVTTTTPNDDPDPPPATSGGRQRGPEPIGVVLRRMGLLRESEQPAADSAHDPTAAESLDDLVRESAARELLDRERPTAEGREHHRLGGIHARQRMLVETARFLAVRLAA